MSNLFQFLWGLALFLVALELLEDAASHANASMQRLIKTYTKGAWRSIGVGTFVTTILQSSSVVSLIILAFVGSGVIPLLEWVGLIVWANLGTTIMDGLVTFFGLKFDIKVIVMPLIAFGGLTVFFIKKFKHIGFALFAFGLMFLGLDYLKKSVGFVTAGLDFQTYAQYPTIFFFAIGVLVTALMHSSSGVTLLATLALQQGVIDFGMAMAIVMGANIGTTITAVFGAWGKSVLQKQIAASHVLFNVLSVLFWLPFFGLTKRFLLEYMAWSTDLVKALTIFVIWFNFLGAIVIIPFLRQFVHLVQRVVPSDTGKQTTLLSLGLMNNKATSHGMMLDAIDSDMQMYRGLVMDFCGKLVKAEFEDFESMHQRYSYLKNMWENLLSALHHWDVDVTNTEIVSRAEQLGNLAHGTKLLKDLRNDFLRISQDKELSIQTYWAYYKTQMEVFQKWYNHFEWLQKSPPSEQGIYIKGLHDDDEQILQSFAQGKQSLGNESLVSIVTMQRQFVLGLESLQGNV
jgi:Na/Pi-cotransporter